MATAWEIYKKQRESTGQPTREPQSTNPWEIYRASEAYKTAPKKNYHLDQQKSYAQQKYEEAVKRVEEKEKGKFRFGTAAKDAGASVLTGAASGFAATGAMLEDLAGGALDTVFKGAGFKGRGLFNTLYNGDTPLAQALRNVGLMDEGIKKTNEYYQNQAAENAEHIDTGNEKRDKVLKKVATGANEIACGVGNALPMAAGAMLGAPAAAANGLAAVGADGLIAQGARVAENSGMLQTLSQQARAMLKDKDYWTSFAQEVGIDYNEALEDGATEAQAAQYAVATALLNAGIEIGSPAEKSGLQNMAKPLWKSALEEGKEEIEQGPVGRLMKNVVYGKNAPIFSTTDEDAVINPAVMAKEFGMGAAVGGLLGGGQRLVGNAAESIANKMQSGRESKKLGGNGVVPYSEDEMANWSGSKKLTVFQKAEDIKTFVNSALSNSSFVKKGYYGKIGHELAGTIKDATGYDFEGKNLTLRADNVRKIRKDHGSTSKEALRGQRAVEPADYERVPEIIENAESIEKSAYQGKPAAVFSKTAGNEKTNVILVDSGGSLDVYIQTMYINKKGNIADMADDTLSGPLPFTSETPAGTVPDSTISQIGTEVKADGMQEVPAAVAAQGPAAVRTYQRLSEANARVAAAEQAENMPQKAVEGAQARFNENGEAMMAAEVQRTPQTAREAYMRAVARYDGVPYVSEEEIAQQNAEKYGEDAQTYLNAKQTSTLSAADFDDAWSIAYAQGAANPEESIREGYMQLHNAMRAEYTEDQISDAAIEFAYELGRKGARGNERTESGVREGGQRNDGARADGQAGGVEERAGKAKGAEAKEPEAKHLKGRPFQKEDLTTGVKAQATVQMVTEGETKSMKRARVIGEKRNLDVHFFRGGNLIVNGVTANGCICDGEVWIRADDPEYTAEQIMRHEAKHDAIAKGEVDPYEEWQKLEQRFGVDRMDSYVEAYAKAVAGMDLSEAEIEEEILCDAAGGMNKFEGKLDILAAEFGEVLDAAAQENAQENTERGPPEGEKNTAKTGGVKGSIVSKDGKQYVKAARQVLTGSDAEAWAKQIENYINEEIRKGEDVVLPTSDNHLLILTERSAYKMSDRHVASIAKKVEAFMSDESFSLKGRIATHIDEMIKVAKFQKYKADESSKHENDIGEDGFNYYDAYFEDFDGKYYRVRLSAALNENQETAYSIGKVTERKSPASSGSSSNEGGALNGRSSSTVIIRTSGPNSQEVKTAVRAAFEKALAEKGNKKIKTSAVGRKAEQLAVILENNPVEDDYHTWIRSESDILTLQEAIADSEWDYDEYNPDWTRKMAKEAIESGTVTAYSSKPITKGGFVSPSKMEAESYSGTGKVYSKRVAVDDVAWIDPTQGQYAPVKKVKASAVSRSADSEYMKLAEDPTNNRERLQQMVDEAAKAAGYDSPMLYHGTTKFGFTEIDTGKSDDRISFFTTTSADMAQTYSSTEGVRQIGNKNGAVPTTTQEILDAIRHSNLYKTGNVEYFDNTSAADEFVMKKIERTMKMAERRMDEKHFAEFWAAADLWMTKQTEQNRMRLEQATLKAEYALRDKPSLMRDLMENATKMFEIYDCLAENQPVFWYGNEAHLTDEAQVEASRISDTAGNYSFYGRTDNLLQIDANGENWNHIPVDLMALKRYDAKDDGTGHYFTNTRNLAKYAKNNGYSGVKIMNVVDNGGRGTKAGAGDIYIYVGDQASQQLKSADTVTYDEDGEIIPLSERFSDSKDIRFSATGTEAVAALEEQNKELQEQVKQLNREKAKLQKQVESKTAQANKWKDKATFSPERVGRDIIRAYQSTVREEDIHEEIKELLQYAGRRSVISYQTLKRMAAAPAQKIVQNAVAQKLVQYGDKSIGETVKAYNDIKKYHKGMKIVVSMDVKRDFWDWNGWKKENGKAVNVVDGSKSNVEAIYREMRERFGEDYYPADIVNPADQLRRMAEVMAELKPVMENPYSYNMAYATEACANELAAMAMQEVARGYAGTITYQLNEKLYRAKEETQKALEKERERREKEIAELKLGWKVTEENRRERQADSEARDKLFRMVKRLSNRKLPAASKALLKQYIGDLDTISRGMTGETINDLTRLKHWYEAQVAKNPDFIPDERTMRALGRLEKRSISDMTSNEVLELTKVLQNIEHKIRTDKELIESEEKRNVRAAARQTIAHVADSEGGNKTFLSTHFTNELLTPLRAVKRMTGYAENDPLVNVIRDMEKGNRKKIDYSLTNKSRFSKWTDNKKLMEQWFGPKALEIEIAGISKKDADIMAGSEGTGEFQRSITRVKITPAMRMSLFLHSMCKDNLRHIAGGGITIPDMKLYKKGKIAEAYARGTTITLTPSQVRSITTQMSNEEKAFAFAAQAYFNNTSKEAINATSEALVGYSIAEVENYYPIVTDPNFSKKDIDTLKFDGTIEGMGFLKERIESSSPLMLQDMNSVLMRSIDNHAKYVGMAIPVRNMNKLLGITEKNFDGAGNPVGAPGSLMDTISKKWGKEGLSYLTKVLTDEQGGHKSDDIWGKEIAKLSSNYAGAVLTLGAGTAIKQAASYPTAAAVVGWSPLIKALRSPRVDTKLVRAYTPLLAYRAEGFSTPEQGGLKDNGKQIPKALNWIQAVDVGTTTLLWRAAEIYVDENYTLEKGKNVMEGNSPYYKKVAEIYNRIIEETQPNYTTMQRSQLQRSDNQVTKLLNMFKTQPFQNFNILYDSVMDYRAQRRAWLNEQTEHSEERMKEAEKNMRNAISSQAVAALIFSLMQFAWDTFRRKDDKYRDKDGDITFWSWLKGMGINTATNAAGMVPFGTELFSLLGSAVDKVVKEAGGEAVFGETWYGFEMSVLDAVTDVGKSAVNEAGALVGIVRQMSKADEQTDWESFARDTYAAAEDISVAFGVPVGNVKKLLSATAQWTMRATHGKWVGDYYALRIEQDPSDSRAKFYDLLYRAYKSGDTEKYKELYGIIARNDDFATSTQTPEEAIKSAMESRMKKDQGVSSVKELKGRYKAP